MARGYSSNISQVSKALLGTSRRLEPKIRRKIIGVTAYINTVIHTRVPVWSGRTVRNMVWSKNRPVVREIEPIASGDYGEQSRRGPNEAAAKATYQNLSFARPFGKYILSNNARHIQLIEDGAAPTPERARFPAGAFRLTVSDVMRKLQSGGFS